jgi:S-adenosylmethionine decarboxylase proenzyme
MNHLGKHVTLDAHLSAWPGSAAVLEACERAIAASGMNVECAVRKDFRPHGTTAVWVLSESHFTLHTYPEINYLSVDCYTCGEEGDPAAAIATLVDLLRPVSSRRRFLTRGVAQE